MALRFALITTNPGKAKEFEAIFSEYELNFRVEPLKTPELQSLDLEEIAVHSAEYAYMVLREPILVEDAGLFIDALNGFPGPYSSYVYRTLGVEGVLKLMENVSTRGAKFRSVLVFYSPLTEFKIFSGEVEGFISERPRGSGGFGFDPIFIPREGDGRTFAEMSLEEKNRISHRARAARKFIARILKIGEVSPPYR